MSGRIRLIGVPLDLGAGRRGVDMGPSALRIAGIARELKSLGFDVVDDGNVTVPQYEAEPTGDPGLRFLQPIAEVCRTLYELCRDAALDGAMPVVLGGDHSLSMGSVAAMASAAKAAGERVGVVWLDAHADFNTPETTRSGSLGGMPVAVATGRCLQRMRLDAGLDPPISDRHVVMGAVRLNDPLEQHLVDQSQIA